MLKYDAAVVGGGPGGYECAIRLAQNGIRTVLIEETKLGGTCLNRGCIPTKTLLHSAQLYYDSLHASFFGVTVKDASFDYEKIIERKDAVSNQLTNGVAFLMKSYGVDVIHARAEFADKNVLSLSNNETVTAKHIVLATGSVPASLPIPGINLDGVLDSTALLSRKKCPSHIIIVGGGVIGIEFATFFQKLGVQVTIVEMLERVLMPLDPEISHFEEAVLKRNNVQLHLGVRVNSISSAQEGLCVHFSSVSTGEEGRATGDVVLIAGGRKPNTKGMNLEKVGVAMDRHGFIETDGLCRTSLQNIYAIGDANGKMQLAHVASAQGLLVADHIAGKQVKQINLNHIPSVVYCDPEAASVGLTEELAKEKGHDAGTGKFSFSGNGKALTMGKNEGFVKLVFDRKTEEILGCHIVGPDAANIAAEVAAVMESEGTVVELGRTVHPHPSTSEVLMEAAHACHGNSVNTPKQKR